MNTFLDTIESGYGINDAVKLSLQQLMIDLMDEINGWDVTLAYETHEAEIAHGKSEQEDAYAHLERISMLYEATFNETFEYEG